MWMLASYNAGPGNFKKWTKNRNYKYKDTLLMLESLPARETRNYIKLVLTNLWVYKTLRVAVVSSGNELIKSGKKIKDHQVYDSNKYQIIHFLKRFNISVHDLGILKDDEIIFTSAVAPAKNIHDFKKNINMVINFSKVLNNLEFKKLIYISSDAIYSDSKKPLKEASKKCPDNWHGLMHLMRENILKRSFKKKKLVIVRPTLVYGKGDTHSGYGPNLFIKRAKKNKNIVLFGNGEELRDHIWINNVINNNY